MSHEKNGHPKERDRGGLPILVFSPCFCGCGRWDWQFHLDGKKVDEGQQDGITAAALAAIESAIKKIGPFRLKI